MSWNIVVAIILPEGSEKGSGTVLTANLLSAIVIEAIPMEGVSCVQSNQ